MYGKKTILFIDEIHRFNKGQQDYLLPFVEDGTLILMEQLLKIHIRGQQRAFVPVYHF